MRFRNFINPLNQKTQTKKKKVLTYENAYRLLKGRQNSFNGFESKIFPTEKQTRGKVLKILTPKRMLQILQIALVQVKVGNTSENLLNEIRQIKFLVLSKRN